MLSMINRGRLDQATQEEFEHLITRLRGFLSQSFDENGDLIVADPSLAVIPVGGVMPFAGPVAPNGWLLCNGVAVSRVTYKPLFDVIGTVYGAGDGAATFNVPDMRGRVPIGAGQGTGLSLRPMGALIGEEDHTLNTNELAGHTHDVIDPGHTHSVWTANPSGTGQGAIGYGISGGASYRDINDLGHPLIEPKLTGITSTAVNGGGAPHNTMQPSAVVNYLIFAGV